MICDDNEIDKLEMFQVALSEDYKILTADSEEDCIDKNLGKESKAKKIDTLLLDYRLGDMQVETVAKKVKELIDVRVIIVSAYDLEEKMVEELKAVRQGTQLIYKKTGKQNMFDRKDRELLTRNTD